MKQYMEDEHICINDLLEELGAGADASANFPSGGAFYVVCNFSLLLLFLAVIPMLTIVHFACC